MLELVDTYVKIVIITTVYTSKEPEERSHSVNVKCKNVPNQTFGGERRQGLLRNCPREC